ncbi:alginate export family protein [Lacibacter sediminis]|uniref:Alginate export family protein n=1 Tax=Lacibacter sediminis TaxID=2760713 RepID=A0A7G5XKB8_9BACT|nr:alginate export family protein [Lacibacter sediminis]QNA45921.1 alginate export family protein [Lacibacter sediminis]
MKYLIFILNLFLVKLLLCQQVPLRNLRYDEDYSVLKTDTVRGWYNSVKFIPLSSSRNSFLSFGGEYRYQLQYFKNENWGDIPKEEYMAVYNRLLIHSDLHIGKHFRLFGQLVSTSTSGRVEPARSVDENWLDVHQVFLDVNLLNRQKDKLVIRAGRQELLYGSQRLISVREGPNNRLSFDALKLFYKRHNFEADAFYSKPVRVCVNVFDDPVNQNEQLWSSYLVFKDVPLIQHVDVYYIGYQNTKKSYNNIAATETRHSVGTRLWKWTGAFRYDVETLYQFGMMGDVVINAYTVSANLQYHFRKLKLKPVAGLKTELISGDVLAGDNRINTFNPLFPRGAYFGLVALIGPVNLIDIHPSIEIELCKGLLFIADYDLFWRYSQADGIYGPNAELIYPAGSGKYIGDQLGLSFDIVPSQHVSISPEFTFFRAGKYLKDVSPGKNIIFSAITLQFKY